ncbi:hypothetical protein MBANPS3_012480 [Mucor bainieri]
MYQNLTQKVGSNWSLSSMTEDTLAFMVLDPIMNAFLDSSIEGIQYHGADYEPPESRTQKCIQAISKGQPTKHIRGRKRDRSGEASGRHVFLTEIKTSEHCKDHSDLVKLGSSLKDVIDSALYKNHRRQDVSRCRPVGFYLMHEAAQFQLPSDNDDLCVLEDAVEALELCRALVVRAAQEALIPPSSNSNSNNVRWNSNRIVSRCCIIMRFTCSSC